MATPDPPKRDNIIDSFKKLFAHTAPAPKAFFQITIQGTSETLEIDCRDSIPAISPVIPWHLLVPEKDSPPHDQPYVRIFQVSNSAAKSSTIRENYDKHVHNDCENLKAYVVIGKCSLPIKDFSPTVPILIVSPDNLSRIKQIFRNHDQLSISSVPLSSSEMKQKSDDFSMINNSEKLYNGLYSKIRNSIRDNIVMSTHVDENEPEQRLLHYILSSCQTIGEQTTIEMINDMTTNDHVLLINTLLKRENFQYHFNRDFPVYITFGEWFYSSSTTHREKCNEDYVRDLFSAFVSENITDLQAGLDSFIEAPDFIIHLSFLTDRGVDCMKCFIGVRLLELLEHLKNLKKPEPVIHETFVAVSVSIRLFIDSQKLDRAKKIWNKHFVDKCRSICFSEAMLKSMKSGIKDMNVILKMHPHLMFNWDHLFIILLSQSHPLSFVQSALEYLSDELIRDNDPETPFLIKFLEPLSKHIITQIKKHNHNDIIFFDRFGKTRIAAFKEGLNFIDYICMLIYRQKWSQDKFWPFICSLLDIFVSILNFKDRMAIEMVSELSTKHVSYTSYLFDKMVEVFKDQQRTVLIGNFVDLFSCGKFENEQILRGYLIMSGTQAPSNFQETGVIPFIELCTNRLTQAEDRICLTSFICAIGKKYTSKNFFFIDLVCFKNMTGVMWKSGKTIIDDLEVFFDSLLSEDNLYHHIPSIILKVMVYLPSEHSDYHTKYIDYLLQRYSRYFDHYDSKCYNDLLAKSCYILSEDAASSICVSTAFTVLNITAQFVSVDVGTFVWLKDHGETLKYFAEGFSYSKKLNHPVPGLETTISTLREALKHVTKCTYEKNVTFEDMNILGRNYNCYDAMWRLLIGFGEIKVELDKIHHLVSSYDDCIKDINKTLLWKNDMSSLAEMKTISVLRCHNLDIPNHICLKMQECLDLKYNDDIGLRYRPVETAKLRDVETLSQDILDLIMLIESSLVTLFFISDSDQTTNILEKFINHYKVQLCYFAVSPDADSNCTSMDRDNYIKLKKVVQLSEQCISRLLEGSITFKEVLEIFSLEFLQDSEQLLSVSKELKKFVEMKSWKGFDFARIEEGLKCLVFLFNVYSQLDTLHKTCKMFNLEICCRDPIMLQLLEIVNKINSEQLHETITLNDGIDFVEYIKSSLKIKDSENILFFELISTVLACDSLYRFCLKKQFGSVDGYKRFQAEYKLVRIVMEKEDYCEQIINQLRGAMFVLSPFLNRDTTLKVLISEIHNLSNIPLGIRQLTIVESNIAIIKASFNTIEGETHELIMTTLKSILKTGKFVFVSVGQKNDLQVFLEFNPLLHQLQTSACRWNLEKIERFSMKLTFFNAERRYSFEPDSEENIHINRFKELLNGVQSLMRTYTNLRQMGHQEYMKISEKEYELQHNFILQSELKSASKILNKLVADTVEARNKYKELSLISQSKLRIIYDRLLKKNNYILDTCIDDIGMYFNSSLDCRNTAIIETNIDEYFNSDQILIESNPAQMVAGFLACVLKNVHVNVKALESAKNKKQHEHSSQFKLYSAVDFDNMELVELIFWIFEKEFPFSFQLLRCSALSTTKEDLELFFKRVKMYPDLKYLVMGVNCLTMENQQVLIALCSTMKSEILNGEHDYHMPDISLVEFTDSIFQNMPWMSVEKINKSTIEAEENNLRSFCRDMFKSRFKIFQVIKGLPGCGKTHFIKKQLQSDFHDDYWVHNIDESFTKIECIERFRNLSREKFNAAIYLNISLILSKKDVESESTFVSLANEINWFFFDYLILGYVEESKTGLSLRFPEGVSRSIYVEVPYWNVLDTTKLSKQTMKASYNVFRKTFPVFDLLGSSSEDDWKHHSHFAHDPKLSVVFKYLRRYEQGNLDLTLLPSSTIPIKIEAMDPPVSVEYCDFLLDKYIPNKLSEKQLLKQLYLKYLERRCRFMEECPQLMFNSAYTDQTIGLNTRCMRSILFKIMLKEVDLFCQQTMQWSDVHSQLIYNFSDGGASFEFVSCNPSKLSEAEQADLKAIGIKLLGGIEISSSKYLHKYLSAALGVPLNSDNEIDVIKNSNYVLTKDFTLKMLNIHERKECGMPVIIEGETGVGKTFLVEMLSKLWNEAWKEHVRLQRERVKEVLTNLEQLKKFTWKSDEFSDNVLSNLKSDIVVPIEHLEKFLSVKCIDGMCIYQKMRPLLNFCWYDPSLACLEIPQHLICQKDLWEIFKLYDENSCAEWFANILYGILYGKTKTCFYKLNINAVTTPEEVCDFFREIVYHADAIQSKYKKFKDHRSKIKSHQTSHIHKSQIITVFLDEINTASCPGFLKQIIIDRTLSNKSIPTNVFIVAACNPYRGNSQIFTLGKDSENDWLRASYYVQPLAPTLELLKWSYGALRKEDEHEYVLEKLKLCSNEVKNEENNQQVSEEKYLLRFLATLIHKGQNNLREYAYEQLCNLHGEELKKEDAKMYATSCVSQRDIQRVFILYEWLLGWFKNSNHYSDNDFSQRVRATFVSIGIAYYFRLNSEYREKFKTEMDNSTEISPQRGTSLRFSKVLQDELDKMIENFKLPSRIAATQALKENIYATVVCILTKTPLIIVGPPGSSKTVSIKIISSCLKGIHSESKMFQNEELFPPVDQHSYQCSRRSNSNEIEALFKHAINHKNMLDEVGIKNCTVVVMDEAGLTEESHESLKVLHYYLDKHEVSFVALSNHMLDAAKTNRAVSLYRVQSTLSDLKDIARRLFPSIADSSHLESSHTSASMAFILSFIHIYVKKMSPSFLRFYGVRDIVHFLLYLSRGPVSSPKTVVEALERNFNGNPDVLEKLITEILKQMGVEPSTIRRRKQLDIFNDSLNDRPKEFNIDQQVRYKLVIDSSEDDSLIGMLLAFGVFNREKTTVLICTKFPGDPDSVKTNTIASVRYAAEYGKTVVLLNCEDIEESFYDLFNQNFTVINQLDETKSRLYANIAVGAQMKMCFVDPEFQCIVVIKKKNINDTPSAYLNRFEKYCFTHKSILNEMISSFPKSFGNMVTDVLKYTASFVETHDKKHFYGFCEDTVSSLMLSCLVPVDIKLLNSSQMNLPITESDERLTVIIKTIINHSIRQTPVCFSKIDDTEPSFSDDVTYINSLIKEDTMLYKTLTEIDLHQSSKIVSDALDLLMEAKVESDPAMTASKRFAEAELVHFCFKNWLQLFLCKKLLHLMKPEALVIFNYDLPLHYKKIYLKYQFHFSLSKLIHRNWEDLKRFNITNRTEFDQMLPQETCRTGDERNIERHVNKAVYYTKSNHLIQELIPLQCFWWDEYKLSNEQKDNFESFFGMKMDLICTYYFTQASTFEKVQTILKRFFQDDISEILIFVADMKCISQEIVNQTRIMIAEIEYLYAKLIGCNKLLVLLLHYPSSSSNRNCYPAIFQHGWDHYYIDSMGSKEDIGNVNIVSWLSECCFNLPCSDCFVTIETLRFWLEEMLPTIAADIEIKCLSGWPKVERMTDCVEIWKMFLIDDKNIANILMNRFISYWTTTKVIDVSNKSLVSQSKAFSLSMTGKIEAEVLEAFHDFVLYMLSFINKQNGLHVLFLKEGEFRDKTLKLFLNLLSHIPLPSHLEYFKAAAYKNRKKRNKDQQAKALTFPFFKLIFKFVENILDIALNDFYDSSSKSSSEQEQKSGEFFTIEIETAFNQPLIIDRVTDLMFAKMGKVENITYFKLVIDELKKSNELLESYINDALSRYMDRQGILGCELLLKYFYKRFKDSNDVIQQLCAFHVNLRFHDSESKFSSSLFTVHCIDDILCIGKDVMKVGGAFFEEATDTSVTHSIGSDLTIAQTKLMKLVEFEDLGNVPVVFSKCIQALFSILSNIIELEQYSKFQDISNVYFRLINVITTKEHLKELQCQTVNTWIMIHTCIEVRDAMLTCVNKEEFNTSIEDFILNYLKVFSSDITKDEVIKMKDISDHLLSLAFNKEDISNLVSSSSLPKSAFHILNSIFGLYITKMKIVFFHNDDFTWLLELINKCNNVVTLRVMLNYLQYILSIDIDADADHCTISTVFNNKYYSRRVEEFLSLKSASYLKSSVYIPKFYRNCPKVNFKSEVLPKKCLREPLADSYFHLVVELLTWNIENTSISSLLSLLKPDPPSEVVTAEKLIFSIEKEAIIHVIITKLAEILTQPGEIEYAQMNEDMTKLNSALNSEHHSISTNGIKGHGILFALRFLQACNSSHKFAHMMTASNFKLYFQPFNCLRTVPSFLALQSPNCSKKLPILQYLSKNRTDVYQIYGLVQSGIKKILKLNNDPRVGVEEILKIGSHCYAEGLDGEEYKKLKWSFNMMLFIVVYELTFKKKMPSRLLANQINEVLYQYIEKEYLYLIIWFCDRAFYKELFSKSTENYMELESFLVKLNDEDQPLLEILLQITAVVIGGPKEYSHMWTHLCNPSELKASCLFPTLLTTIEPEKQKFYPSPSDVIEFKNVKYIDRNSLNYQSLSLIHLINYGTLIMALLAKPDDSALKEALFPKDISLAQYCCQNLETLWTRDISNVLNITDEEKEFLVSNYLLNFYESTLDGSFVSIYNVDIIAYERKLHQLFLKSWNLLKKNKRYEGLSQKLAPTLRSLECSIVPVSFGKQRMQNKFLQKLLSSTDLGNRNNKLYILYQFILRRNRLNAGGRLLPFMIYCYNFISDKLSFLLTKEIAKNQNIEKVLDDYLSKHLSNSKEDVMNQFRHMTSYYKTYSLITGSEPLPSLLIDLVSYEENNGALYYIIFSIIKEYNEFINEVKQSASNIPSLRFMSMTSDSLPLSEIDAKSCCFGNSLSLDDVDDLIPFIKKHCISCSIGCPGDADPTCLPDYIPEYFNLEEIQLEIVQNFIIHKQSVSDTKIKKEFCFFKEEKSQNNHSTDTSIVNIEMTRYYLQNHSDYLVALPQEELVEFKNLFHSLHYKGLLKVLIGFSLLVKYLSQVLCKIQKTADCSVSVSTFIAKHIEENGGTNEQEQDMLKPIGIEKQTAIYHHSGVKKEQYIYLCRLNMTYAFSIVETLSNWMSSGLYDFFHLPCSMKTELSAPVHDEVYSRIKQCRHDSIPLVQSMIDMLIDTESEIKREVFENRTVSFLKTSPMYKVIECKENWKQSIAFQTLPESIQVQHYVYLHIHLRSFLVEFLSEEHVSLKKPHVIETVENFSTVNENEPTNIIIPELTQADISKMSKKADSVSTEALLTFLVHKVGFSADSIVVDNVRELDQLSANILYSAMDHDDQLVDIGIQEAYLRLKFRVLFERFLLERTNPIAEIFTITKVAEVCRMHPMMRGCAEVFEAHQIDGEMLWLATTECLDELGIDGVKKSIVKVKFNKEVLEHFNQK